MSLVSTRRLYLKSKVLKVRGITKKFYSIMTIHINDEVNRLMGVLNLEKFVI